MLLWQIKNAPEVTIDGHEHDPENDEHTLIEAVANEPVSISIDAGGKDFQFYSEVSLALCVTFSKSIIKKPILVR